MVALGERSEAGTPGRGGKYLSSRTMPAQGQMDLTSMEGFRLKSGSKFLTFKRINYRIVPRRKRGKKRDVFYFNMKFSSLWKQSSDLIPWKYIKVLDGPYVFAQEIDWAFTRNDHGGPGKS